MKRKKKTKAKQRRAVLIFGCIAVSVSLVLLVWLILMPTGSGNKIEVDIEQPRTDTHISLFSSKPKIPRGTYIGGIAVGGMTEEKALEKIENTVSRDYEDHNMDVEYAEHKLSLTAEDTGVHWDISAAIKTALNGDASQIPLNLAFDRNQIYAKLESFFDTFGGVYSPSGYYLEGERPNIDLLEDKCQTLVLSTGKSGLMVDLQDIVDQIVNGYQTGIYSITVEEVGEIREAKPLDLEEVFDRVTTPAVNPDLDRKTLEVLPGKKGYGFDIREAESLLSRTKAGETVKLKMRYLDPTLDESDVWFQDTLGYYKTEHTDNENRNENLRLACSMLDGKILEPGGTLSYNQTLGQRTRAAGYKPAPAYSGTELIDEIGGGICQVSSTLYLSSLFAELHIVERKNHGFPTNYIPLGLDATVNWGTTDLVIRNDYDLPVKILAEVSDGYVKVHIMGVEQRDYYVKMEYRVDDHPSYAAAYRCRYDRATDEQISRALDHTSPYLEDVWCWPGFAECSTDD